MNYPFTFMLIAITFASMSLFNSYSYGIEWKNYSNDKITLQIPSNWNVTEKQNRFEDPSGTDLTIVNPLNENQSFTFTDHLYIMAKDISLRGLEQSMFMRADLYEFEGAKIVEGPDLSRFNISGYATGTITAYDEEYQNVIQDYIVDRDRKASLISYSNSVEDFDSSESQDILTKIISSIKLKE
jgi:hypothetical protein